MSEGVLAVVLAAGRGSRMHSDIQKQYLMLRGKPVVVHALEAFERSDVTEILLVTGAGEEDYVRRDIVDRYHISKVKQIIAGGRERFESVCFALQEAEKDRFQYVLIHDGARAFITPELIREAIDGVKCYRACVTAVPVKDTIKVTDEKQYAVETPDRASLWQMQTPQSFVLSEIYEAYRRMMEAEDDQVTDDAMVMERYGSRRVKMVMGSYENIKLTTPDDLIIGDAILSHRETSDQNCD